MVQITLKFQNSVYDFSKAKVRCDGRVLDKFDVAHHLDSVKPSIPWTHIFDAFTYKELKVLLYDNLSAKLNK